MEIWDKKMGGRGKEDDNWRMDGFLLFLPFSSFDKMLSLFSFPTDFSCVSSPVFGAN